VCCLRYFNVYGKNQFFNPYSNVLPIFAKRALNGKPLTIYGNGEQTRDFIDVEDVVSANLLALDKEVNGVFNIGTGVATSINELAAIVIASVDMDLGLEYARSRNGDVIHAVAEIVTAEQELGFSARVSLSPGIRKYVSWVAAVIDKRSIPRRSTT
jgi:nucleoside-diphosphate-sugar epimerase